MLCGNSLVDLLVVRCWAALGRVTNVDTVVCITVVWFKDDCLGGDYLLPYWVLGVSKRRSFLRGLVGCKVV